MTATDVVTAGSESAQFRLKLRWLIPWAVFAGLPMLLAITLLLSEQSVTALIAQAYLNEFVQNGRHSLGISCH
ncbi:CbtB-domain containing protein [Pseudomonas sp. GM_Psu_2]|uniref:CbtB-domain containing protein n=1 Tax=unclassified Pseudomonas TaxID=196821 RepID=UPI00226AB647|nr:CbtB-domain containing protein [Pseudomonas sp. GM_Psu_2]